MKLGCKARIAGLPLLMYPNRTFRCGSRTRPFSQQLDANRTYGTFKITAIKKAGGDAPAFFVFMANAD